jgi:hypothetical protein
MVPLSLLGREAGGKNYDKERPHTTPGGRSNTPHNTGSVTVTLKLYLVQKWAVADWQAGLRTITRKPRGASKRMEGVHMQLTRCRYMGCEWLADPDGDGFCCPDHAAKYAALGIDETPLK